MLMLSIAFALFRYLQSFFLEGKIQPFALELGLVHTNMTFTEREKAFGSQIFFSSNRLQYASISDKTNYVVQMGDCGRTSINEDREVFNLPPIEDGDRHFIRGEYRPVDSYGEPVEPVETSGGNTTVDKGGRGGIIEERKPVFGEGHKIVDNKPESGDEGGSESDSDSDLAKILRLDDVLSATAEGSIQEDVAKEIYNTIAASGSEYKFDKVVTSHIDPKIVMQTDAVQKETFFDTTLVLNENFLGGKSVDQIDREIKNSRKTVANSLQEAVIHETYHARLISGLNMGQLEGLYDEMSDYHIQGVSPTAYLDGTECIAEVGVLLTRGEKANIPSSAMDLFDQYMEGKK